MTDPEFADATYVEPITPDVLEKVIASAGDVGLDLGLAVRRHSAHADLRGASQHPR
jgi:hypothetical protein